MRLTLRIAPGDAAGIPRLPILRPARAGRSSPRSVRIVWHDTLDRTLAGDGLALAEERDVWRMERLRPAATEPWPPATDHRVVEEAASRAAFDARSPETLAPVAAFDGRRTTLPLSVDGDPVTMTLLTGVLRAVAAERPVARLVIDGADATVRTLALSIADAVPVWVPGHSLATEALHLADGGAPPPRRLGAPALPAEGFSVASAFAHIIGHLTDVMLHWAPRVIDETTGPEPVHQMRVAVRRARSALSLFPAHPDNAAITDGLKQLSDMLAPARDWDVFMTETAPPAEANLPHPSNLTPLLRAGGRRRHAARKALAAWLDGAAFRRLSLELACVAAEERASGQDTPVLAEFAATTLRARWKKMLNAGKSLDTLDSLALHDLRLKAKRLRYAAEFFAPMFPEKPTVRFIRRLSALQERLGEFNDTASAEALLRELGDRPGYAAGLVLGFTAARGAHSRPKIASTWARLRKREPFWT